MKRNAALLSVLSRHSVKRKFSSRNAHRIVAEVVAVRRVAVIAVVVKVVENRVVKLVREVAAAAIGPAGDQVDPEAATAAGAATENVVTAVKRNQNRIASLVKPSQLRFPTP